MGSHDPLLRSKCAQHLFRRTGCKSSTPTQNAAPDWETSDESEVVDHPAQAMDGTPRRGDRLRGGMGFYRQRQWRLVRRQGCRQQGSERNIAVAEGDEAASRVGVVFAVENIGERQQLCELGR